MESDEVPVLISEHLNNIEMVTTSEENTVLPIASHCNSICAFSRLEHSSLESQERKKIAFKLFGLIVFYLIAMAIEIVGGLKANSLAVLTDAAHLLTDIAGLLVSLLAVWASGWEATPHHSFGFSRLEVLGALLSMGSIWLISGILTKQAVDRILNRSARVKGGLMFVVAAFGFIINLIMVIWLGHEHSHHACHHHHHHVHNLEGGDEEENAQLVSTSLPNKNLNINIQGAYLHAMADLFQSVGVMIAGALIWAKPNWFAVDLICTVLFSAFALCTTLPMLRDIYSILMNMTPEEINVGSLEKGIKCIKGVRDIHDLHVWAITVGKLVLSCHVVAEPGANSSDILSSIRDYCEKVFRIHHVTIQIEQ
ncbi:hypothetical protein K2173_015600 [Erythroxylum novogranatense]|uniref:Uncharacterized protein n=1 Tax=Erythroxylum novogranatense TaxID=1862640 RepID=A0AAV8SE51_9ROSI|nr:hypothetical protein K2173_015600 [Erythroxylum novogranatense]